MTHLLLLLLLLFPSTCCCAALLLLFNQQAKPAQLRKCLICIETHLQLQPLLQNGLCCCCHLARVQRSICCCQQHIRQCCLLELLETCRQKQVVSL
jgi:hypothetical protein